VCVNFGLLGSLLCSRSLSCAVIGNFIIVLRVVSIKKLVEGLLSE
jgi:hypothetical protein